RGAIRVLRDTGIVEVIRPKGTFIRTPPTRTVREPSSRYQWEKDRALLSREERLSTGASEKESGLDTADLEFSAKYEKTISDEYISGRLGVEEGTQVLKRTYSTTSIKSGSVIGRSNSYIPLDIVDGNPDLLDDRNEPWPGGTQHQLSTVGVEVDSISDRILARVPTVDERESMKIPEGTPLFVIEKTSIDIAGRIVEFSSILLPADRAELKYSIPLKRWKKGQHAGN
ncbi:GntR family transcriptional regulator, partial [Amycolatopsis sulphurea]